MLERSIMYIIFKGVAIAASVIFMKRAGAKMDYLLILVLAFSCILTLNYLCDKIKIRYSNKIQITLHILLIVIIFLLDMKHLYPLLILIIIHIFDNYAKGIYFYYIIAGMMALTVIIINPPGEILFFTVILIILLCYIRIIRDKAENLRETVIEQKEELVYLNQKLSDNRRLVKTLQYTAALEERNRLAARLHDKVGHGISGSIILLEATELMLDQNPEKAKESLNKAIGNLRVGVDDIRAALREERPIRSELGLSELNSELEQFQANHNIKTKLNLSGNSDMISIGIWQCIHENLEESLTNLLKHSNATEFSLSIQVMNKIIKVEYSDNGKSEGDYKKGLGLEAIEERTLKSGGRCFFEKTNTRFRITNIFTY
jgi:signal transduction histidine kinase